MDPLSIRARVSRTRVEEKPSVVARAKTQVRKIKKRLPSIDVPRGTCQYSNRYKNDMMKKLAVQASGIGKLKSWRNQVAKLRTQVKKCRY